MAYPEQVLYVLATAQNTGDTGPCGECHGCGHVVANSGRWGRPYRVVVVSEGKPWERITFECECCEARANRSN
jgi:hypothetical protein